ncbi:MAG TPA: peptide deformylase [Aridibacter sp.]|nr:peptide deformylase [Aridibacter sp.]
MPLLKIVHYPDPLLLEVGKPVAEQDFGPELEQLVANMFETMYSAGGVGLAAPQVGVSKRLFVMDCSGREGPSKKVAIFNPEILTVEGEQYGEEGCLSFPGIITKVKREMRTVVRFQDVKGDEQELDLDELQARCVLHETDHCDGIVFLDRMSALKREMAKRKIKRFRHVGEWV